MVINRVAPALLGLGVGLSPFASGLYKQTLWGPIGLAVLVGLLAVVVAMSRRPPAPALLALGGLVALWLWSLLSVGWSESADQALVDANRWLLYAAFFGLLLLLVAGDSAGRALIAGVTVGVLIVALYLVVAMLAGDGRDLFAGGRIQDPLGYVNGQAGHLLLGLWPLVAVAETARRRYVGALACSGAALVGALLVLTQTRGAVLALAASMALLVALVPGRARRVWVLAVVGAGVAVGLDPLLDAYSGGAAPSSGEARTAAAFALVAAAVAGLLWVSAAAAAGAASGALGPERAQRLSALGAAGLVAILLAAGLVALGDPIERVSDEYDAFARLEVADPGGSRFASGGGYRHDYWRVALDQFSDHPLRGIGAGNYDRTWFLERRTTEDVKQPHSLPLQTLAELGLVGALCLALLLAGVGLAAARRLGALRAGDGDHALLVAAAGMVLVWLVHTSVDWLHLIPGVTGMALCGAAALVAPTGRDRADSLGTPVRIAAVVLAVLAVVAGTLTIGRVSLAEHYRLDGRDALRSDPEQALERARQALEANDESLPAYYLLAGARARLGDYPGARAALLEATRREPHDFLPWALLGDLYVRRGDFRSARDAYARASALNPRDETLRNLARDPRSALSR